MGAQEVMDLNNLFRTKITKIRSESAHDAESAKRDLTEATEIMYEKMAEAQKEQIYANEESASKADFEDRLDTLTNTVAANHKHVEHGFEVLTGVIRDYKEAGEHDRELIKDQNAAMGADMQKAITAAIQMGEARAKGVQDAARSHLAGTKKSLLIEITNTVEETADRLFQTIQGKHQKIADNYQSLKAYAVLPRRSWLSMSLRARARTCPPSVTSSSTLPLWVGSRPSLLRVSPLPTSCLRCSALARFRSTIR